MIYEQMTAAIEGARTLAQLDALSRTIWQAFGVNAVSDDQAQALAELIHAKRGATRTIIKPVGIPAGRASIFPPRRAQVSPDRVASRLRRRRLAASGPMPPALAANFTTAELAALRIIADEVKRAGVCGLCLAAIAARAGTGRTTVQNAIRAAARLGLLTVQERRREGQVNLPNLVRVVSREWLHWLRRGGETAAERIGFKLENPTDKTKYNKGIQKDEANPRTPRHSQDAPKASGEAMSRRREPRQGGISR